jgi:hypothetical protein
MNLPVGIEVGRTNISVVSYLTTINGGYFAQEQLGWKDWTYLTVRADMTSPRRLAKRRWRVLQGEPPLCRRISGPGAIRWE